MQGGTAATQDFFIEHTGIPTLAAVRLAAEALREIGMEDTVQLVASGGIRSGADVAKALALGADAVSVGVAPLIALGCNSPTYWQDGRDHDASDGYRALGTEAGYCHHCHTGLCPVGVTTQDAELEQRLDVDRGARQVTNYLKAMAMETAAPAASPTCTTWNPTTSSPSPWRRPPWPRYPWPAPTGFPAAQRRSDPTPAGNSDIIWKQSSLPGKQAHVAPCRRALLRRPCPRPAARRIRS
jgi:hypothetical protein